MLRLITPTPSIRHYATIPDTYFTFSLGVRHTDTPKPPHYCLRHFAIEVITPDTRDDTADGCYYATAYTYALFDITPTL